MTKKRNDHKRKVHPRLGCLLGLVLLAFALVAGLILLLRPAADEATEAPAAADALWDGSWYDDDLGRIENDRPLVRGMKAFEKRTGSKPYLSLQNGIDPEELDLFAREQYEALFSEGDHLLVIYDEWGEDAYYLSAQKGPGSALTEADLAALLSCIEQAYADPARKTYAEAFGAGFSQGAKRVSVEKQGDGAGLLVGLGLLLLALAVILVLFLRKRALYTEE